MSFTRTPSGLTNLHRFYGVDVVAFLEGGSTCFSYAQVCSGGGGATSIDMIFWQFLFGRLGPSKRIRFRAVGSKATARQIANALTTIPGCSTVYVAMDRDTDGLGQTLVKDARVLYSWGYSWENDVSAVPVLVDTVLSWCPVDRTEKTDESTRLISDALDRFFRDARNHIRADVLLLAATDAGLFHRKKPHRHLTIAADRATYPLFNATGLPQKLHAKNAARKSGPSRPLPSISVDVRRDCFGHLLATLVYHLILHVTKVNGGPAGGASYDVAMSSLVRSMGACWNTAELASMRSHHERQFAALV